MNSLIFVSIMELEDTLLLQEHLSKMVYQKEIIEQFRKWREHFFLKLNFQTDSGEMQ